MSSQVYATLLTNDAYLPGALVLAQSLRDAGSTVELAVLITPDTVSEGTIATLRTVYTHIIEVPRASSSNGNLSLLGRADLHSAMTKIHLWRQTQFSKIVYIDADVVALRAPDELFELPVSFAAAPDIGWPDCFNSGVMVLTPSLEKFNELQALVDAGVSFDGADQGLLNQAFPDWHRISFTYNVTPSAHYQYLPAYNHFRSQISLVHFIGKDKPWSIGRASSTSGSSPYNQLASKWFSVFDKHYGTQGQSVDQIKAFEGVRRLVLGEFGRSNGGYSSTGYSTWDPSRAAPPVNSGPEAGNLPTQVYSMSTDIQTPAWSGNSGVHAPIFPWEQERRQAMPTRIFWDDPQYNQDNSMDDEDVVDEEEEVEDEYTQEQAVPAVTGAASVAAADEEEPSGTMTPTQPYPYSASSDGLLTPSETLSHMTSPTAAASSGPSTPPALNLSSGYFESRMDQLQNTAVAAKPEQSLYDATKNNNQQQQNVAQDYLIEIAKIVAAGGDPLPELKRILAAREIRAVLEGQQQEKAQDEVPMYTADTYLGAL